MNLILTQPVEIALRTLSEDQRRQVWAWLDHLKNWETDPIVRQRSNKLALPGDVYVLRTNIDYRIFFSPQQDRIEVLDIATKATIMSFGQLRT